MNGRKWWIAAGAMLVIAALACNAAGMSSGTTGSGPAAGGGGPADTVTPTPAVEAGSVPETTDIAASPGVLAVAFLIEGSGPLAVAYAGNPAIDLLALPPGTYEVQAFDPQKPNTLLKSEVVTVGEDGSLKVADALRTAKAIDDPQQTRALRIVWDFLIAAEEARMAAMQAFSNNYTTELFATTTLDPALLDRMYHTYGRAAFQAQYALEMMGPLAPSASASAPRYGRPAAQNQTWFDRIKDSFNGFFNEVNASDDRAVDRIAAIGAELTPGEKEEAFNALSENLRGDAANFDELVADLQSGELDYVANQVHTQMSTGATGYAAAAQQAGARSIDVAYDEGTKLVQAGAEFNAQVIKTVLGEHFGPDFTRGLDLADQINQWAQYANDIYEDPAAGGERLARDQIQQRMTDRIKQSLEECCADTLSPDQRDQIASTLGQTAADTVPTVAQGNQPGGGGESGASGDDDGSSAGDSASGDDTGSGADDGGSSSGGTGGGDGGGTSPADDAVMVTVSGGFTESITGVTFSLSSNVVLVADFTTGFVSAEINGRGIEPREVECREDGGSGALIDSAEFNIAHTYTTTFTEPFDTASGSFSAPLTIAGHADWTQVTQFTDERCDHLNVGTYQESWSGSGSVSGRAHPNGEVTLTTDWSAGNRDVSGTFSGRGRVETP